MITISWLLYFVRIEQMPTRRKILRNWKAKCVLLGEAFFNFHFIQGMISFLKWNDNLFNKNYGLSLES